MERFGNDGETRRGSAGSVSRHNLGAVGDIPEVQFTRSGEIDLAYQVMGEGPLNIVLMIGWVSHLEVLWELAEARHFIERFTRMGRVVLFDKPGTGLSDRPADLGGIERLVPDVLAVMDAAGMPSAAIVGWADAAAVAMSVAAAHPDRVTALVLGEMPATTTAGADHPWAPNAEMIAEAADAIYNGGWGQGILLTLMAPSAAGDARIAAWFRKLERTSATPSMAAELLRRTLSVDLRPILADIAAPALIVHRRDAAFAPSESLRWLAERLPRGKYVELPGDEVPGYLGDVDALMDEVEEFLVGTRVGGMVDRRIVTVVFTDVVGSTERVATEGDRRWRGLLEALRTRIRSSIARYGGTEVDTAGDGFFIAFTSPRSALECALEVRTIGAELGLRQRIGVHTGEVIVRDGSLTGMAVHVGARVSGLATPDQICVSQTVRDLMVGSGFHFETCGVHELKGVPGKWELLELDGTAPATT